MLSPCISSWRDGRRWIIVIRLESHDAATLKMFPANEQALLINASAGSNLEERDVTPVSKINYARF